MSPFLHPDWPAPAGVHALVTLRHGAGQSSAPFDTFNLGNRNAPDGDSPDLVERNRRELETVAALPSQPRWLRQVHGTRVLRFGAYQAVRDEATNCDAEHAEIASGETMPHDSTVAHAGTRHSTPAVAPSDASLPTDLYPRANAANGFRAASEPEADASITDAAGVVLAILSADCLPVLFSSSDGSEVGAAHAGWRGLADGVLEATVAAMHTSPDKIVAWLGPAAGPAHYEVGVEVYDAFVAKNWADGAAFTSTRPLHWRVDLYALARRRLLSAGIGSAAIFGGELCTISDPRRFFSHRRDRRTGRMASLIWIDDKRDPA